MSSLEMADVSVTGREDLENTQCRRLQLADLVK